MKNKILFLILSLQFLGCGYSSRDNTTIGQVMRIHDETPIFCENYIDLDFSLGVLRNGQGSVSSKDIYLYIPTDDLKKQLVEARDAGYLVKITYDEKRFSFCHPEFTVKKVEVVL